MDRLYTREQLLEERKIVSTISDIAFVIEATIEGFGKYQTACYTKRPNGTLHICIKGTSDRKNLKSTIVTVEAKNSCKYLITSIAHR